MARCSSLCHARQDVQAAAAIACHDEAILQLLNDVSTPLLGNEICGVSIANLGARSECIQATLAPQSCLRQVCIQRRPSNGRASCVTFLGAVIVPPLTRDLQIDILDDFGVCASAEGPGKTVCELPPASEYYVSLSCAIKGQVANTASNHQHLVVFSFHESTQAPPQMTVGGPLAAQSLPEVFRLCKLVQLDVVSGIHEAPILMQLRVSADPFFPQHYQMLFDTPPHFFAAAVLRNRSDPSLWNFTERVHEPVFCISLSPPPKQDISFDPIAPGALCSDGHSPALLASDVARLVHALGSERHATHYGMRHFDMFCATLHPVLGLPMNEKQKLGMSNHTDDSHMMFKLVVPGLHEGKPQIFRGDAVYIRSHELTHLEFCCCAIAIVHSNLILQVPGEALPALAVSCTVHVRFTADIMRLNAISEAGDTMLKCLNLPAQLWGWNGCNIPDIPQKHDDVAAVGIWSQSLNEDQLRAVNLLQKVPVDTPPLLLLGPAGTGKSFAITALICSQLDQNARNCSLLSKMLVCAPTDIACDLLVDTVHKRVRAAGLDTQNMLNGFLLRFNEPRRPLQQLFARSSVLSYSLVDATTGGFQFPTAEQLAGTSVIVCTLKAAWWLRGRLTFDIVLIDEAGQALEVETYTALLSSARKAKILLAGDPKQLGPTSRAVQHKLCDGGQADLLRRSILQRLSEHPRWRAESPWVVRLVRNDRSHPEILNLLSSTRYEGSLLSCADPDFVRKFENLEVLPVPGFPILFVGVRGQQQKDLQNGNEHCLSRPDVAHSYHNPQEALAVFDLVVTLLSNRDAVSSTSVPVSQDDIGIVCSFRRQVQKIRGLLRKHGFDSIRVGTVEDYQGQEERILIISTTISDPGHAASVQELEPLETRQASTPGSRMGYATALEACIKMRLKSEEADNGSGWLRERRQSANLVGNVRRFTVALSRAQCLLVVVGSPEVLEVSPHWRSFLSHVVRRGSLAGERPRPEFLDAVKRRHCTDSGCSNSMNEDNQQACQGPDQGAHSAPSSLPAQPTAKETSMEEARAKIEELQAQLSESAKLYSAGISRLSADLRIAEVEKQQVEKQVSELQRQRQEDHERAICEVCTDMKKEVLFLPCGHIFCCRMCHLQMLSASPGEQTCPTCRQRVQSYINVFI
eukprot:TRINITY_DN58527_c0_g1_i1.p1 TRINITY_DN58527_c0_g1~~TRINITY_DN58527_c0_g1_i1.p1  ORF type:complete len:1145 (+),score=157.28 TRINITY_DN58527_c0_g1_i1:51-3485(+)